MRKITRKELTTLTLIASAVSIMSFASMQEQTKRRTLNEEIAIVKNFFTEPSKTTQQKKTIQKPQSNKKITIRTIKERAFRRFL